MPVVASPINVTDQISAFLRPSRSPRWPNSTAPSGRATNALPKVTNAATVAGAGPSLAKNTGPSTSAGAVAKRVKS